ncbi:GNAT family N-acetyltransferase [Aeromicrobium fastidiosum]|uniref:GNAT family N-acetyltransferase n=1 Tax=Aeromicrobium fastidiosum TaxID=52699 RepID=A0A641AR41_9ACTN|nr:GNAT family N-acetyltransferase [Aeromicrobium fastidiosum]KAA1380576.1 GNAT family N-acetyltransferase [Aeromicrobium fastidiosum]MBP2390173.1 GNAT superfamily N-acetyltransferase [Aeromicrobium fastidiosum]
MSIRIDELPMPHVPGGDDFAEYAALSNDVETHTLGTDLLAMGQHEMLSEYVSTAVRTRRHLVARDGGTMVGRAMVTTRPLTPEAGAHLMVDVLPTHRRRGIGAALLEAAEALATRAGAPVLKVAVAHSVRDDAERVEPPTGFGDLPADDPGVRFLLAHGYALEQVTRISLLDAERLRDQAASPEVPDDYRLLAWAGPTPPEWMDQLAALRTRMSTDAPSAGMVVVPDPWDAGRVREHDQRIASSGRTMLTTVAEHVPSGVLAGFTEVVVSDGDAVAVQEDTLVLTDHRGRRLGMLLKKANAQQLVAAFPDVEAVVTWNAEENRPMLDVNEQLGFREIGREGGWQKRL